MPHAIERSFATPMTRPRRPCMSVPLGGRLRSASGMGILQLYRQWSVVTHGEQAGKLARRHREKRACLAGFGMAPCLVAVQGAWGGVEECVASEDRTPSP